VTWWFALFCSKDSIYGGSPVQYLDESFRTEKALSVIMDDSADASPVETEKLKQGFADSRHFNDTGTSKQSLQDSHGSSHSGLLPGAGTTAAIKETSTPGRSKEGKRESQKDAYSHVHTKYYTNSKRASRVASREDQISRTESKATSHTEKGVFHATSKTTQYITAEYSEESHGEWWWYWGMDWVGKSVQYSAFLICDYVGVCHNCWTSVLARHANPRFYSTP